MSRFLLGEDFQVVGPALAPLAGMFSNGNKRRSEPSRSSGYDVAFLLTTGSEKPQFMFAPIRRWDGMTPPVVKYAQRRLFETSSFLERAERRR